MKLDLLILSDRKQLEATYGAAITKSGMAPVWASDVDAVLHELQHRSFDAIAIDFDSTSIDCIKACSEIVSASLLPVFALASQESEEVMLPLLGTQISGTFQIPTHPQLLAERIRLTGSLIGLLRDVQLLTRQVPDLIPTEVSGVAPSSDSLPSPFVVSSLGLDSFPSMDEMERKYTEYVLDCVGGNRSQAARILGLSRKTLWRKLRGQE